MLRARVQKSSAGWRNAGLSRDPKPVLRRFVHTRRPVLRAGVAGKRVRSCNSQATHNTHNGICGTCNSDELMPRGVSVGDIAGSPKRK